MGGEQQLCVHLLAPQLMVLTEQNADEVVAEALAAAPGDAAVLFDSADPAAPANCNEAAVIFGAESAVDTSPLEGDVDESEPAVRGDVLSPRSKSTFFRVILAKQRLWRRPPDDHCDRCAKEATVRARLQELTVATTASQSSPEWPAAKGVLDRAGGLTAALEELRKLTKVLPDLQKHVLWRDRQRVWCKHRETTLEVYELLLQLDYGGFTDSRNRKVNCWSATAICQQRPPEHFDFFFDSANQVQTPGQKGFKKNGQAGIWFIGELLAGQSKGNGQRHPSALKTRYPKATHLILSGDTGNGYRAYEMLEELSKVFEKYSYSVDLIPLGPGHAFNRTDQRFAHMNVFLRNTKAASRIFGAYSMARAFHVASDPNKTSKRKLIARSNVFFSVVKPNPNAARDRKLLGAHLEDTRLDGGHMGVKGFLWFEFACRSDDGLTQVHPQGYARVREHADPTVYSNPTYMYTWRKDLTRLMCQECSNQEGRPVPLLANACTKKTCAVLQAAQLLAHVPLPLLDPADQAADQAAPAAVQAPAVAAPAAACLTRAHA